MAQSFCINSFCLQNISKNTVVIVAGPTASGKSDWATFYAQQETQDTTGLNTRDPAPKDLGIKDRPIKDLHSSALAPEPPPGLREHAEQTALVAPQSGLATREKSCVQKTGGRIINGDSIQLYRGLDLLTAMPSPEDRMRIDHDLYGIFSPYADTCSVAQWMEYANKSIAVSHENGQRAWVVGGTGFYLKALTQGLSPIPILDAAQKAILRNQHADTTIDQIKTMLQPIDAISAEKFVDKQRLLHAWIVHTLTGKPLSWWHLQKPIAPALHFVHVLIWPSRNLILHRAEQRWEKMIHHGVYQEVQAFCSNPLWQTSPLRKAIGVQPIHAMLQGQMSEKECRQQYLIDIAQYVKRQRTWFRGQFKPDYVYTPE